MEGIFVYHEIIQTGFPLSIKPLTSFEFQSIHASLYASLDCLIPTCFLAQTTERKWSGRLLLKFWNFGIHCLNGKTRFGTSPDSLDNITNRLAQTVLPNISKSDKQAVVERTGN
jgi:hypothetical protein